MRGREKQWKMARSRAMLPHARTFVQRTIDRIFAEKMAEELTAILFDGTPGRVPVTIPFPDGTFDPRRNPFHE